MKPEWISLGVLLFSAAVSLGQEKKLEPMRGVNRGQPQPSAGTMLMGINDNIGAIAEPGWPLIVSAVTQPDGRPPTLLPSNLNLKVTDERGTEIGVPFEPVSRPATSAGETSLFWLASEATTMRLAPGRYRLSVVPEQGVLTGWRFESGEFQVVAPNPERSGLLGHLKLHRFVLLGKDDDALAEADRLIAANAKDKEAWIAKGDILMLKDNPDDALQAFDGALKLHKKADGEPLAIMTRRRNAFFRSMEKRGVAPPQQPPP